MKKTVAIVVLSVLLSFWLTACQDDSQSVQNNVTSEISISTSDTEGTVSEAETQLPVSVERSIEMMDRIDSISSSCIIMVIGCTQTDSITESSLYKMQDGDWIKIKADKLLGGVEPHINIVRFNSTEKKLTAGKYKLVIEINGDSEVSKDFELVDNLATKNRIKMTAPAVVSIFDGKILLTVENLTDETITFNPWWGLLKKQDGQWVYVPRSPVGYTSEYWVDANSKRVVELNFYEYKELTAGEYMVYNKFNDNSINPFADIGDVYVDHYYEMYKTNFTITDEPKSVELKPEGVTIEADTPIYGNEYGGSEYFTIYNNTTGSIVIDNNLTQIKRLDENGSWTEYRESSGEDIREKIYTEVKAKSTATITVMNFSAYDLGTYKIEVVYNDNQACSFIFEVEKQ